MKKISIITVCYNSAGTICRTFNSVLGQSYPNIEYWVIDGRSSDGTIDVIKEYEPKFKGKMHWISEEDHGIYDAMNKGIKLSTGELIGILNSDDYYEPDAVRKMVDSMTNEAYQILYGAMRAWKNGVEESISISSHLFLRERMINHPACFVTKAVYDRFGDFDVTYKSVADYDFMLRMFEHKEIHFIPVYDLIVNFTLGGMCSTDEAYEELMKMRSVHGLLSKRQYRTFQWKSRLHQLAQGLRGN